MKGILGRKVGMTQLFTSNGNLIPVTIVEVKPNVVTNVLTNEKNGYVATQLALEDKKRSQIKKPEINHFKKASTTPKRFVKEIRNMSGYKLGDTIDASLFSGGEIVDVTAISKGKGFAGTIKDITNTLVLNLMVVVVDHNRLDKLDQLVILWETVYDLEWQCLDIWVMNK